MPVARARSRLVKLILRIASTIGRASKLVMSICSTGLDRSSCLRVSLTVERSISSSVVMSCSNAASRTASIRACRYVRGTASPHFPLTTASGRKSLQLHHVRALALQRGVEAGHRLVVDDMGGDRTEAVEASAHRAAVGAEHSDL